MSVSIAAHVVSGATANDAGKVGHVRVVALALSATVGGARMGAVLLMAAVASVLLSALLLQPVLVSALQWISVLASVCCSWRC